MDRLIPVAFHGDTLYLVEIEGEPFTPARPICEAIGVSWSGQHEKLTFNPKRWGVRYTLTPTAGGDQETVCIPVRKLSGWLASINAAKVKPEIREKMEAYQAECDDALWRYWTEGHASRPNAPAPAIPAPAARRPRTKGLPKLCAEGWIGDRIPAAVQQLECAANLLYHLDMSPDQQTTLDLLTAAHTQCQTAALFIANHFDEVRDHA